MMLTKKLYIGLFAGLLVVTQSAQAMFEPWNQAPFFQLKEHPCLNQNTIKMLHSAAQTDDLEAIRQLLTQKNINIDEQDDNGQTPLYLAVKNGHLKIVKLLIVHGANIYLPDKQGVYAREIAKQNKNLDIVTYLELLNDLFILHKNQMTFENFANTYLELKNPETARKNWKHAVKIATRIGLKEIKKELYNWGIKQWKQNNSVLLHNTIVPMLPAYLYFFILDTASRLEQIKQFKISPDGVTTKKIIEKLVERYNNQILDGEREPLYNAYSTVFKQAHQCNSVTTVLPTTKESDTFSKLSGLQSSVSVFSGFENEKKELINERIEEEI